MGTKPFGVPWGWLDWFAWFAAAFSPCLALVHVPPFAQPRRLCHQRAREPQSQGHGLGKGGAYHRMMRVGKTQNGCHAHNIRGHPQSPPRPPAALGQCVGPSKRSQLRRTPEAREAREALPAAHPRFPGALVEIHVLQHALVLLDRVGPHNPSSSSSSLPAFGSCLRRRPDSLPPPPLSPPHPIRARSGARGRSALVSRPSPPTSCPSHAISAICLARHALVAT